MHLTKKWKIFPVNFKADKILFNAKKIPYPMKMNIREKHMKQEFIAPKHAGRIDSFLSEHTAISRSKIKKYMENNAVSVNGLVCTDPAKKLLEGDCIAFCQPQEENSLTAAENKLTIYYQDKFLAVIEKKPGLTVHPCPSCQEETLVNHLLYHFPSLKNMEGERPGIVHRLDKDTSGLMLVALTEESRLKLSDAFSEKEIHKTYLALVEGICPNGESRESIGRHPTIKTKMALVPLNKGGREAYSEWERIYPKAMSKQIGTAKNKQDEKFSLVKVLIHTGRTHQIRVHFSAFGYPLLGDDVYAPAAVAQKAPRQMLHAYKLNFTHPFTGEELEFTSLPPADFWQCLEEQLTRSQKAIPLVITGNPGSGKSALLEIAARQNLPTFSADNCIRELYQVNNDAWYVLKQQYGTQFVPDENKPVDKIALANAMQDPTMKQELENLLHPLVYSRMLKFFADNEHAPFAVAEIPLWFESKPQNLAVKALTICVSTQKDIRYARLKTRRWTDETIAYMESWQIPQEEKIHLADFEIPNNEGLAELEQRFLELLHNLQEKNTAAAAAVLADIKKQLA